MQNIDDLLQEYTAQLCRHIDARIHTSEDNILDALGTRRGTGFRNQLTHFGRTRSPDLDDGMASSRHLSPTSDGAIDANANVSEHNSEGSMAAITRKRTSVANAYATASEHGSIANSQSSHAASARKVSAVGLSLDAFDQHRSSMAMNHGTYVSETQRPVETQLSEPRPSRLQAIIEHNHFATFFGCAILSNAVLIAIETDYQSSHIHEATPEIVFYFGMAYTCLFAAELGLRMAHERLSFFTKPEFWNYLDFVIVATSLFELFLELTRTSLAGMQSTSQIRITRIIRCTKLLKVVRVARLIKFIRALRTLVHQIMSALKSLVWSLLLLFLVVFLFACAFTQAVSVLRSEAEDIDDIDSQLMIYWSSLPRSMFTLFKAITGGLSWDEVVEPLSDAGELSVALFVVYISFVQLAVLNVLTGVFCQNAIDSAKHDQELVTQAVLSTKEMYIRQVHQIFKDIDTDQSGTLTIQEFEKHLSNEHVKAYFDALELDASDIWVLFKLMDNNGAHEIDSEEFVSSCLRLKGAAKGLDLARLAWDHSYMSKRLHRFIRRTDDSIQTLSKRLTEVLGSPRTSRPRGTSHFETKLEASMACPSPTKSSL